MAKLTKRIFPWAALVFASVTTMPVVCAAEGYNAQGGEDVLRAMQNGPSMKSIYSACPADVFRRERGGPSESGATEEACAAQPMLCWTLCSGQRDAKACFQLARAFQRHGPRNDPRSQILFTMACARGLPAGCTNRGAGVRNAAYDNDPLRTLPKARRESCTTRSFDIACRQGDSWGCFMHGQAVAGGEGVRRDMARARASYAKACTVTGGQDVLGCPRAKQALEDLNRRR